MPERWSGSSRLALIASPKGGPGRYELSVAGVCRRVLAESADISVDSFGE